MRHRVSLHSRALALLLVGLSFFAAQANAQPAVRIPGATSVAVIEDLLTRGQKLEAERRWGDAISLYEEALRNHPGDPALEQRFELSKLHYDIGRRYSDKSFCNNLTTLGESRALDLYAEVLLKVQSHYVQSANWQGLVGRGTKAVDLALSEDVFWAQTSGRPDEERIDAFRRALHQTVDNQPIRSRYDARDAVALAARLAQKHLGVVPTAIVMEYLCGATGGLDEYSSFLTGDQLNDVYSQIEGNFVGLGIELKADSGALLILNVIPGSPAERAGIRSGDRITAVDGRSTAELTTDQAANLLQGQEGSLAEVVAVSPGEAPRRVRVRREHVDVCSVEDIKVIDAVHGVGYFKLTCFQKTTTRDIDAALWKLHREGMKSLIMDLRGNPGGLLTSSVEVADKFIEDGVIVSTRGRSTGEDFNYTAHKAGTWRVPLIVLIDGDSASASEIFAGAIRDHRRGVIIGQRSYGKGSVQGIFPLSMSGAGLRLTTSKFYSPNGRPYSKVGVEPDIQVTQVAKPVSDSTKPVSLSKTDDPVISAAVQTAIQQVAQR